MMRRKRPCIEMVDDAVIEVLRGKSPAERLAIVDNLWRFAQRLIRSSVKRDHPDWSDEQVARETARRISNGAV
ncbi:MAG: hypothetical protein ACF8PN_09585 [Phycisphaerales bacterium]